MRTIALALYVLMMTVILGVIARSIAYADDRIVPRAGTTQSVIYDLRQRAAFQATDRLVFQSIEGRKNGLVLRLQPGLRRADRRVVRDIVQAVMVENGVARFRTETSGRTIRVIFRSR